MLEGFRVMRVLVCGGRTFDDWELLAGALDGLEPLEASVIIHGAAPGADALAGRWAELRRVRVEAFPADWARHGRAAGPIRNARMLGEGQPDVVVAFPGGRGTANMVKQARAAGVLVDASGPVIGVMTGNLLSRARARARPRSHGDQFDRVIVVSSGPNRRTSFRI